MLKAYKLFVISMLCSLQYQDLESCELPGNENTVCVKKLSHIQKNSFAASSWRKWSQSPGLLQKNHLWAQITRDIKRGMLRLVSHLSLCRELPAKHRGIAPQAGALRRQNKLRKSPWMFSTEICSKAVYMSDVSCPASVSLETLPCDPTNEGPEQHCMISSDTPKTSPVVSSRKTAVHHGLCTINK